MPLYVDRIEWVAPVRRLPTDAEAALVVERVRAGLEAMDLSVEIVRADNTADAAFVRESPQLVRHRDGYTVRVGARSHIDYEVRGADRAIRHATVGADATGRVIIIEPSVVRWTTPVEETVPADEARRIVARVTSALEFMSLPYELRGTPH